MQWVRSDKRSWSRRSRSLFQKDVRDGTLKHADWCRNGRLVGIMTEMKIPSREMVTIGIGEIKR